MHLALLALASTPVPSLRADTPPPYASPPAKPMLRGVGHVAHPKFTIARVVLCTLAVQNACQMLSMRYSRMPGQPAYLSSTAVVMGEIVKLIASFAVLAQQRGSTARAAEYVWQGVFVSWADTLIVSIPALLYLVQNTLLYVAMSNLDAATCQVTYQLKLLTTAFFSVVLLKRKISRRRWISLGVLFVGVMLVQTPAAASSATPHAQSPILGLAAVTGACLLSGLAGVTLEGIIKRTAEVPIWLRNIQLGVVSLVLGLGSVFFFDRAAVRSGGFLQGYSLLTWMVVLQVSLGGILVSMVMKYADNVVKGFATSLSIVISSFVSCFIPAFAFSPSAVFVLGSALVIAATVMYSTAPKQGMLVEDPPYKPPAMRV